LRMLRGRAGRRPARSWPAPSGGQLTRWARRSRTAQALALRARILLARADGRDNKAVAAVFGGASTRWRGGGAGLPAGAWPGSLMSRGPAAAVDLAGQGRGGLHRHPGRTAEGRDALVTGLDGQAQRAEQVDCGGAERRRRDRCATRSRRPRSTACSKTATRTAGRARCGSSCAGSQPSRSSRYRSLSAPGQDAA